MAHTGSRKMAVNPAITMAWAMPNQWTFDIEPVARLIEKYGDGAGWFDPYAGNSSFAMFSNDIRETGVDAFDFLHAVPSGIAEGVLIDPPYSANQRVEVYADIGKHISITAVNIEAARILRVGGIAISFGWNSNGVGKKRGMDIVEVLLVAHGGRHNDTICTVERKRA